jgi:hypothetical protein
MIIPVKYIPVDTHCGRQGGKATRTNEAKIYNYAQRQGQKKSARAKGGMKGIGREQKARATQRFSLVEQQKREERAGFEEEIKKWIEWWRKEVEVEKEYDCEDKTELRHNEFMHKCWKKTMYAFKFQARVDGLEHMDAARYHREFVSIVHALLVNVRCANSGDSGRRMEKGLGEKD